MVRNIGREDTVGRGGSDRDRVPDASGGDAPRVGRLVSRREHDGTLDKEMGDGIRLVGCTAIGRGVNLASRLEAACATGGVLVSAVVRSRWRSD